MFCGPRAHSGGPQPSLRVRAGAQPSVFERLAGGEERVAAVIGHDTRFVWSRYSARSVAR